MAHLEILGNKDEIQAKILKKKKITSMNAHDKIIQGSHRSQRKTSQPSEQPMNLQTPQPPKPQEGNISDQPS